MATLTYPHLVLAVPACLVDRDGWGGGAEGRTQRARWSLMEPYGALIGEVVPPSVEPGVVPPAAPIASFIAVAMMPPSIASCSVVIVTADGVAGTAPCGESLATPLGAAGALGIGLAAPIAASLFCAVAPAVRVGAGDCTPVTEASPPIIFSSAAAFAASIASASIVKASQRNTPTRR